MQKLKQIRFLWADNVYHEYVTGSSYNKLGSCLEIIEHKEGSHYELIFSDLDKSRHMNVFPKINLFTVKEE
jgi:predicted O-methyltransferase YrrM